MQSVERGWQLWQKVKDAVGMVIRLGTLAPAAWEDGLVAGSDHDQTIVKL